MKTNTQHLEAMRMDVGGFASVLKGLERQARDHERLCGAKLAEDYLLGKYWLGALISIRGLLNSVTTGKLDCATVDSMILGLARSAGFKESDL